MGSRRPPGRTLVRSFVLGFPLLGTLLTLLSHPAQDPTAPFPRRGDYAGKTVCKDCHEDEWDAILTGYHRGVVASDGFVGCETCHGPGKLHAEDEDTAPELITHPPTLRAGAQTAVCVQCHRDQVAGHGGDPAGFLLADKGCTSCHTVHDAVPAVPHEGVQFERRADADGAAEAVGAGRCVTCHPLRDQLLAESHHATLAQAADATGCETCHGPGSLHVETDGLGRLITRPDRALDGIDTCRSCHDEVHPTDFHWHETEKPLLTDGLTCTSCHEVHKSLRPAPKPPATGRIDPDTGTVVGAPPPATNMLCVKCHAPAFKVLQGTIHQSLGSRTAPLTIGCGSCHAGAEKHAREGGRAALVDSMHGTSAMHQRQVCMTCHNREETLTHVRAGAHFRNEVTCLSCHSPAARAGKVREDAERRCTQCHADVAAQFKQPNRHPVPEGHMWCSDCHNPHDARRKIRDRKLNQLSCVKCHKQYRGPFVFAHQADRLEGCVICHVPHGTSNRRMMRQATTQQNCLQCHADFPSFHDQTQGAVFTNCLSCHTEIHGSNFSRFLFR